MNANGSAGIHTDLAIGACFPHMLWIGIGALGAGAHLLQLATHQGWNVWLVGDSHRWDRDQVGPVLVVADDHAPRLAAVTAGRGES